MTDICSDRVRIVTVGGGTGSSTLLRGLKRYADRIDITAIVTTFDDGGSSGRLRDEYGVPALGDVRRCIAALIPPVARFDEIRDGFEFRFETATQLKGHAFGNLLLLMAMQRKGSLTKAIDSISDSLNLLGRVIPVSETPSDVCATLEDGTVIRGESTVGARNEELFGKSQVYLDPAVTANPNALDALRNADVLVLGPGDLFTSVIPNIVAEGVADAVRDSQARILQICNIAKKRSESGGYSASDFVATANRYLNSVAKAQSPDRRVDALILNEFEAGSPQPENAVELDPQLHEQVDTILVRPVASATDPRVHDPEKLASAVMECVDAD